MQAVSVKVFLDANVLIQEGKTGSPIMERLVDLVDAKLVSILTTDLTMIEVAKKHADNDLNVVREYARPHFRAILADALSEDLPEIDKDTLKDRLHKKYEKLTQKTFTALEAEVLSIDIVPPSIVLNAYSNREGFFSGEGKKDQFPDAFIFECLRTVAKDGTRVIIVSSDGDFVQPSKSSEHIELVKTFPDLFKRLGLEIEAPEVESFFDEEHSELIENFDAEMSSWDLQVADIDGGEIDDAVVTDVAMNHFTAFRSITDGGSILVAGYATATTMVSFTHPNWDTASWDSEEKRAFAWEDVSGEKEVDLTVRFSMTLEIDDKGTPINVKNLSFIDDAFVYVSLDRYETYK